MHELKKQDVPNFRNFAQIEERSPTYLFNMCTAGHILVKTDSKIFHSVLEVKVMPSRVSKWFLDQCLDSFSFSL